ncbi:GNAT family N-acetyltransferase [Streptomyces sp. NBC_01142]|uniref:GNAT family N-acetyltransferase n=1 Tax=Streptomyces sp. NBC_01142 TaxID=2975865 RepID=UPI00225B1E32|nr:GNAT family N-acetyltransferase [Streptomyces sp. NBC_01142]MCX4823164.1 GNAT family N-acetyltransferase [Streptomyces sp. NBC_01142]
MSSQRTLIRRLEAEDLTAVREIYNHAVRRSNSTLDTEEKTPGQMLQWLDHHGDRYPAVAADIDGRLVGYGSLSQFASRGGYRASAEISVYVDPRFQGVGVGTALCGWLTRHAEDTGFTGVLAVITSDNTRSRRLFTHAGYTYTGVLNDIGYKRGSLVDLALYQRGFPANRARYGSPGAGDAGTPAAACLPDTDSAFARAVHGQADAVTALLKRDEAPALDTSRPIVLAGAGPSLHSCHTAAAWARLLSAGRVRPVVLPAHTLSAEEPLHAADQLVLVHSGTPEELPAGLRAAAGFVVADHGVQGGIALGGGRGRGGRALARAVELTVLAQMIAASLGGGAAQELTSALRTVADALRRTPGLPPSDGAVHALAPGHGMQGHPAPLIVAGSGLDAHTAAEVAENIRHGTYRWAEGIHLDAVPHAVPEACGFTTAVCLIRPPGPAGRQADRQADLLRSRGVRVLISSDDEESDMPFPEVPPLVRPFVTVLPFQRLVSAGAVTK